MKLSLIALAVRTGIATGAYEPAEPDLPDGVWDAGPGVYIATCRSCERDYELLCDLADFDPEYSYCAGSDRCIP